MSNCPNNPDYYNNKGNTLYGLGRYGEALKEYDAADKLPKNPHYYSNKRGCGESDSGK